MRINPFVFGILVLIVFFGTIFSFQAAGVWSTSGKVDSSGQKISPSANDVETIKGWMTLEQIADTYSVPITELYAQFDLPAETSPSTAIKDLESTSFDTTILKEWLLSRAQSTELTELNTSVVESTQSIEITPADLTSPTPISTDHVPPEKTITGNTTFQDLLDWGLSVETIQTIIESPLPSPSIKIKDFVTGNNLEFSTTKTLLQTQVDKIK
ncbi:MAG: hypothetical protein AB9897_05695 [Anaerolineaceae bacterium]